MFEMENKMQKISFIFALFCAMFFAISCDSGVKFDNPNDKKHNADHSDPGDSEAETPDDKTDTAQENDDSDSVDDSADTVQDNADISDDEDTSAPDNGDSTPDAGDSIDDIADSQPDDNTDTATVDPCVSNPCIDVPHSTGNCAVEGKGYACECQTHYSWTGAVCKADKQVVDCIGKPENSSWNGTTSITQTWDGNDWYPPATGTYNKNPSNDECHYICDVGYNWNGVLCSRESTPGSLTLGNICTGQDKCYNDSEEISCPTSSIADFYGQDTQFTSKCYTQSFSSLSSNIVEDNNTGLVWEKSPSSSNYKWDSRNTHCNELNSSNYGGKNNWRVPNPLELLTIVDNSRFNPAINSNYFTEMPTEDNQYLWLWTNNEYKGNTSYAYYFRPSYGDCWGSRGGYEPPCSKTRAYKVLCVSGEEMKPAVSSDFKTSSDGKTVTDTKTGLMWIWWQIGQTSTSWQGALAYCQSLNTQTPPYAGYSDWRLPNKNELASLVNHEKSEPPYSYFPDMKSCNFWSSSSYVSNKEWAWEVDFNNGDVTVGPKHGSTDAARYPLCVRNAE